MNTPVPAPRSAAHSRANDTVFEAELRDALRRVPPSDALRQRFHALAANIDSERSSRGGGIRAFRPRTGGFVIALPRLPVWFGGAVAATLLAGVFLAGDSHLRHERQRAEATRQFDVATHIEQQALDHTREQLRQRGIQIEP